MYFSVVFFFILHVLADVKISEPEKNCILGCSGRDATSIVTFSKHEYM